MTSRVSFAPQDFQKMCKQAERDLESKKLIVLMERVKQQIALRDDPAGKHESTKRPVTAMNAISGVTRMPSRSAPFDR